MIPSPPEGVVDDEEQVELREGMNISNEEGEELGVLSALLVEDDDEDAEFFILKAGPKEHLIPFDAILGIGDGALVIDVTREVLDQYPVMAPDTQPSDKDIEKAYAVYEETAQYEQEE